MRVILVLFLLCLAGCSAPPKKPDIIAAPIVSPQQTESAWERHQKQLMGLQHWQAEGRLAVTRGSKGGNASFVWQQDGDFYQIKLFGPFGSGSVYITGGPRSVEIREADGKLTKAASPEQLLQKVSGLYVPVTGLVYWLRGLPTSGHPSTAQRLDNQGHLLSLQQEGWQIRYEGYSSQAGVPLPSKLNLKNNEVAVKMVVTSWKRVRTSKK